MNAEGLGTNPVEGLFSRVRRFLRQNYVRMPSRKNYGLLLAEYCWRRSVLGEQTLPPRQWPKAAFWRLLATMKEVVPREYLVRRASYKQEAGCPDSRGLLFLKHSSQHYLSREVGSFSDP